MMVYLMAANENYLMAAEGKEGIYEQFGFKRRPGEGHMGAGMTKWME